MTPTNDEKLFQPGVTLDNDRPRMGIPEGFCSVLFYGALLTQVVLAFVVFGMKNSDIPTYDEGVRSCGKGMMLTEDCCAASFNYRYGSYCVSEALCNEMNACDPTCKGNSRLLADIMSGNFTMEQEEATPERRLSHHTPNNVWEFLEEHAYLPAVLFLSMFILSFLWLVLMQKAAKPVIWGTIIVDILFLVVVFVYMYVEFEEINWMCIILAVLGAIVAVVLREKINLAAVVMTSAMEALAHNKRLFLVCGGVTVMWGGFFALWIASLITLNFVKTAVKEVDSSYCTLQVASWASGLQWFWFVVYYWTTYFFQNAKLIVCSVQIAAWYFKQPNSDSMWVDGTKWAFGKLSGGNAICSAIMGTTKYLMDYVNSRGRLIIGLFDPIEWIPICIAFALKQCIFTYTKFGLIAHAYTGEAFCSTAQKAFRLLRSNLGEAVICDYLGARVMSWCTWVLSLGIAYAAWAWAEDLSLEAGNLSQLDLRAIIIIGVILAYFISFPFVTLVLIVVLENWLGGSISGDFRGILNVVFASLFCGCITNFILTNVSQIVVNAMDTIFFCFAVEKDNNVKQERFGNLYDTLEKIVAPGIVASGDGVVTGTPAGEPSPVTTVAESPVEANVVGQPVPSPSNV